MSKSFVCSKNDVVVCGQNRVDRNDSDLRFYDIYVRIILGCMIQDWTT